MRHAVGVGSFILVLSCWPSFAGELTWFKWKNHQEIDFGGFVMEMNAIRIIDEEGQKRIVYGDRFGLIHVMEWNDGRFQEEWVSQPLKSAIAEVFLGDIDADGKSDIVAYTETGDIIFYRIGDFKEIWRSTDDSYASVSAMVLTNIDDDPQLELVFCGEDLTDVAGYRSVRRLGNSVDLERQRAEEIGRLFIFDCLNLFVEWESEQGLTAQSIAVGDLDGDGVLEIALNTGFVLDAIYQRIEWEHQDGFGEKIGFADVDGDGVPELIGEFQNATRPRKFLRFFDVDLQAESFLSSGGK